MVELSDRVGKYVDNDTINIFDVLQPLSAIKKRQYKVDGAGILGKGSYGTVIRATWKSPFRSSESERKEVALKIISKDPPDYIKEQIPDYRQPRETLSREQYRQVRSDARQARKAANERWEKAKHIHKLRVRNEIGILGEVDHENIIKFYDCFESRTNFYISTELLRGQELITKLIQLKHFTEATAIKVTRSIIRGISYLHGKGIVHMDMRPENMIFRTPDSIEDLVIIDLGFARDENSPRDLGYPAKGKYLAPEILYRMKKRALISCRPSSDMWAIGVIVHMLLTGLYPFQGNRDDDDADETYCENVLGRQRVDYDGPQWRNVSDTSKDFVASLLHKSRTNRSTASQALKHLWLSDNFRPAEVSLSGLRTNSQRRQAARAGTVRAGRHDHKHHQHEIHAPHNTRQAHDTRPRSPSTAGLGRQASRRDTGTTARKRRFSFLGRLSRERERERGEGPSNRGGSRSDREAGPSRNDREKIVFHGRHQDGAKNEERVKGRNIHGPSPLSQLVHEDRATAERPAGYARESIPGNENIYSWLGTLPDEIEAYSSLPRHEEASSVGDRDEIAGVSLEGWNLHTNRRYSARSSVRQVNRGCTSHSGVSKQRHNEEPNQKNIRESAKVMSRLKRLFFKSDEEPRDKRQPRKLVKKHGDPYLRSPK